MKRYKKHLARTELTSHSWRKFSKLLPSQFSGLLNSAFFSPVIISVNGHNTEHDGKIPRKFKVSKITGTSNTKKSFWCQKSPIRES